MMRDTAVEMAKRLLVDSIWKSANLEGRTIPVQIGGTSWKPEMPYTGVITESIRKIEEIGDIGLRALKYFCYIVRTQMFIDGNKRVAQ